jgi:hypothetical protein
VTIDTGTAAATDVDPAVGGFTEIQGLAFRADGALFGARDQLFAIDPVTGIATPVGTPFPLVDVYGISFLRGLPMAYCTPSISTLGCIANVTSNGVPSATAGSGFQLTGSYFPNQRSGALAWGVTGPAWTPLGGGHLCLSHPRRVGTGSTGGSPLPMSDCSGVQAIDFNQFVAQAQPPGLVAGTTVWAQFVARDGGGLAFAGALRFELAP